VAHVHHFAYGWVTPVLAYLLSYVGCLLGLVSTARARSAPSSGTRARWLVLAAWAIGGTGIWVMHFMAMIGFSVDGSAVGYDITITVASWLTAVVVVGIGLFIVGYGRPAIWKVLVAGLFTGVGVAAMHYSGMSAMRVNGTVSYDRTRVLLSVVIAVVAATVALWFTLIIHRPRWIALAAVIMGVAVTGMHYTGMSAMRVRLSSTGHDVSGVNSLAFLVPILIFVLLVVIALFYALLATPADADTPWRPEPIRIPTRTLR
jgi:NO-binding membrane sensor protein with MHYT domain